MAGLFLIFVLVINLASVPSWRLFFMPDAEGERWQLKFPKVMQPLKWTLRLDQKWSMFAPYPNSLGRLAGSARHFSVGVNSLMSITRSIKSLLLISQTLCIMSCLKIIVGVNTSRESDLGVT